MVCKKCNIEKESYYFAYRSDTNKLRSICSMCHKGYRSNLKTRRLSEISLLLDNKKECSRCHEIKDINLFSKDKNTTTGYCSRCKECIKELHSINSAKIKKQVLKNRYNLTEEEYILYKKTTHCQICNNKFNASVKKCLDHCHNTLAFRGVLCSYCNIGLGHFKDNKNLLISAVRYLE